MSAYDGVVELVHNHMLLVLALDTKLVLVHVWGWVLVDSIALWDGLSIAVDSLEVVNVLSIFQVQIIHFGAIALMWESSLLCDVLLAILELTVG